jgi:DNA-binding transcriptional LysR family regulator
MGLMDKLHCMRVFVGVVEYGGFAAAGRRLGLSAPAVTRAIAALEDDLGTRLIQRSTRRFTLTPAGDVYVEQVRAVLQQVRHADSLVSASRSEPRGRLRLLVPHSLAAHQFAHHLAAFHRAHPLVKIEVTTSGCHDAADEAFDVSLQLTGGGWTVPPDFVARPVAQTEVITCVTPERAARGPRLEHPSQLGDEACLVFSAPGMPALWPFQLRSASAEPLLVTPLACITSADSNALLAAAKEGLGPVTLPTFVLEPALRQGVLQRVFADWHVNLLTLHAAVPTRRHASAASRAFVRFLAEAHGGGRHDPWLIRSGNSPQRPSTEQAC